MHIYRTHLQPDIAICVKGKTETGVISLTHDYRGIWREEGAGVKIRWAVFLCAGQHAGSPMPSKLLSSQAERRSGIWTRASPVSAHIPKARHKWSGQLPVYSPCTSTHGEVNRRWLPAFIKPFFCWAFRLLPGLIRNPHTNTPLFLPCKNRGKLLSPWNAALHGHSAQCSLCSLTALFLNSK